MNRLRFFLCVVLLVAIVSITFTGFLRARTVAPDAPELEELIPVNVHTTPVVLKRIYRPELNLPSDGNGLYVERVQEESIFYRNGIRSGDVIRKLNGRPVNSRKSLIRKLTGSLDEQIKFNLYDPSQPKNTETISFEFKLEAERVVSFRNGPLYHDPSLEHSPIPENHVTFQSPYKAKVDGREPCPVCFPGGGSSIWNQVIHRGIGPTNSFVKQLIRKHGEVKNPGTFIKQAFRNITRHRLRYQVEPSLIVLDTRRLFASGTPDGTIVLSRGILMFAEGLNQKRLLIAHQLAHVDARHPPRSVRYQQAANILKKGIDRVTEVGVGLEDVSELLFNAFGFTFPRRWQGFGYDETHEREAEFLTYYYLRRIGVPLEADRVWDVKRRDLVKNLDEQWANYLVLHPTVDTEEEEDRWQEEIKQNIPVKRQSPNTGN